MKRVSRADVVQAMGVLGVRLSGVVTSDLFEAARDQALAGFKPLMMANHPDRHSASGQAARATARAQEISAAEHLLNSADWFGVAHLFAAPGGRPSRRAPADDFRSWADAAEAWRGRQTGATGPGVRFFVRCPLCGLVVSQGERHTCPVRPDHFNTRSRPFTYERPGKASPENPRGRVTVEPSCGRMSPMGVRCVEPPGHDGDHRGWGKRGRHTWRVAGTATWEDDEKVNEGDEREP